MEATFPKRDLLGDRACESWCTIVDRESRRSDKIPQRMLTLATSVRLLRGMWSHVGSKIRKADLLHWDAIYPQVANGLSSEMRDFTTLAYMGGFGAEVRRDCTAIMRSGEAVKLIPHSDPNSSLLVNLTLYQLASEKLNLTDTNKMRDCFPHTRRGVLQYYTTELVRIAGAEDCVPVDVIAALNGEKYAVGSLESELFLLHGSCLTSNFSMLPATSLRRAVEELSEARQARLKWRDMGVKSKRYMYPGPGYNNTYWKFKTDVKYDFVLHPGSGRSDRLSRRCFTGAKVVCIDPASDKRHEQMTFNEYARANPDMPQGKNLVCSDVAWANDMGMCAKPTNENAAEIIAYAIRNKSDFLVKVAMDVEDDLPDIFHEKIYSFFKKPRLHNAEVIVKNGDQSLVDIFKDLAYVVVRANQLRETMTELRQWPKQLYEELAVYLPPLSNEALVIYEDDKKFDKTPRPGLFDPTVPLTYIKPCFGEITVKTSEKLDMHELDYEAFSIMGRTGYDVAAEIISRCPYMDIKEVYAHIGLIAADYGYDGDVKLSDVVFN